MTIAAILRTKGNDVTSVAPETPVHSVVRTLANARIGSVLVIDPEGSLVGILSERDIVISLASQGAATLDLPASRIMTRAPRTASPRTTEEEAMGLMTDGRFRHLPVVEDGVLVGLVSIGDVVKARITQAVDEVDSLRAYVAGAA